MSIPAAPAGMALVITSGSVALASAVSYVAMVGCSPSTAATGLASPAVVVE